MNLGITLACRYFSDDLRSCSQCFPSAISERERK